MRRLLLITALLAFALSAFAQPAEGDKEPLVFATPEQEQRYKHLTLELRCLVCQNQNLADSDAPLAQQLRGEIFGMLDSGKSDEEIKSFMVDRYGDFVLYRPPVQGNTLALWALPVVFLLIGAIAVFFAVRKRNLKLAEQRNQGATE